MRLTITIILINFSILGNSQVLHFERFNDYCKGWNPSWSYGENYVLYNNSSNYYQVVAEGTFCEDLVITVDSGYVVKNGCKFNIHPQVKKWKWEYNVYSKTVFGIDTTKFFVSDSPPIGAKIKGIWYGHFHYVSLQLDSLEVRRCHVTEKETVDSFDFVWIRGDSVIYDQRIRSKYFPSQLADRFKRFAKEGDRIRVKTLWYRRNEHSYIEKDVYYHFIGRILIDKRKNQKE
jgi:hypothetical protein